jgi:hypothetical protein
MKKSELDKLLKLQQKNKRNIFDNFKDEILYLRENGATLYIILNYLIDNSDEIKQRYESKEKYKTGLSFLSKTIKKWQQQGNNITTAPQPQQQDKSKPSILTQQQGVQNDKSLDDVISEDIDISNFIN